MYDPFHWDADAALLNRTVEFPLAASFLNLLREVRRSLCGRYSEVCCRCCWCCYVDARAFLCLSTGRSAKYGSLNAEPVKAVASSCPAEFRGLDGEGRVRAGKRRMSSGKWKRGWQIWPTYCNKMLHAFVFDELLEQWQVVWLSFQPSWSVSVCLF